MKMSHVVLLVVAGILIIISGFWYTNKSQSGGDIKIPSIPKQSCLEKNGAKHISKSKEELALYKRAYFAGGCFWCTESDLQKATGVIEVISGYAGGNLVDPTYQDVTSETTGHRESVEIYYDGNLTTYENLVRYHLMHIDPTDGGGQFYDRGESYQAVIFYSSPEEQALAEKAVKELSDAKVFEKPLAVRIVAYKNFYTAEEYHQNYAENSTVKYCAYREASGRDAFLKKYFNGKSWDELIGKAVGGGTPKVTRGNRPLQNLDFLNYVKPSTAALKASLSDIQYKVTQEEGTEKPFSNAYNDNHAAGIYVDIVSGEPLYSSSDKYDSGTGWPSFVKPIDAAYIVEKADNGLFSSRTEIRSRYGDNHIGHVFNDGPQESGGRRYCMNSAALRFILKEDMEQEGYGKYLEAVR